MYHPQPPLSPKDSLPTMYDLPSEAPEEPGLPDEFREFQPKLLRETCQPATYPPGQIFIGADLNPYYDARNPGWYKRPDWFLVLGVERARQQTDLRWSYVVWQERVDPFLVVELLSPGTEAEDLGQTFRDVNKRPTKWQVYEQILRVPYYVVFDRYENQLRLFKMVGTRYSELSLPDQYYWFDDLGLGLGVWQGEYQGIEGRWVRWQDPDGNWIPTADERAEQRAARLAERLRALGIDPDGL